ncbi:MAG: hypothetical protein DI526_05755 [Caulobacter segnis]|uniref:Uncharacterized protein n=1 Tax=Caulobacter segnis TaxID=88688 RepID=A0A2W5V9C7_9CAUL|nr:MAG: hypothetical protein DI526_05755 [Caulobacter segnis]
MTASGLLQAIFGPPKRRPTQDQRDAHEALVNALCMAAMARQERRYATARAYLGIAHRCHVFLVETVDVWP